MVQKMKADGSSIFVAASLRQGERLLQRGVLEEEEVRTQRLEESRREAAARLRINGPAVPLFRSFIVLSYTVCFSALSEKLNPWSAFSELFFGPDLLLAPPILASHIAQASSHQFTQKRSSRPSLPTRFLASSHECLGIPTFPNQ